MTEPSFPALIEERVRLSIVCSRLAEAITMMPQGEEYDDLSAQLAAAKAVCDAHFEGVAAACRLAAETLERKLHDGH